MNLRNAGLKWFDEHHQPAEPIRVSKFYPTHESWKGPAWWFEFPPSDVSDQNGWLNLLCQRRNDPCSFHHLRIPMGLFAACKHHLGYRKDKDVFSLLLSAEPEFLFREMRGSGRIEFRHFEHECEGAYQKVNIVKKKFLVSPPNLPPVLTVNLKTQHLSLMAAG